MRLPDIRLQKKELMELAATSFLIIVFLFVVVRAVARVGNAKRLRGNKPTGAVSVGSDRAQFTKPAVDKGDLWKKLQEDGKKLNMKRDPFTGISFVPVEKGEVLSGILWSQEHPLAIINEAIVKIGDKVGASTVTDIRQDRVILNDGVKETELLLE